MSCQHARAVSLAPDVLWCTRCGATTGPVDPAKRGAVPMPKGSSWTEPENEARSHAAFDWEILRGRYDDQPTREATIWKAFSQYVRGNDLGEDWSQPEAEHFFDTFRSGWIIAEEHMKCVVRDRL